MSKLDALRKIGEAGAEAGSQVVQVGRTVHREWRASEGSEHRLDEFRRRVGSRFSRWIKDNYATLA